MSSREILIPVESLADAPALWVCIHTLRLHECKLPIQVMVCETAEWAASLKSLLELLGDDAVLLTTSKEAKNAWSAVLTTVLASSSDEVLVLSPHTMAMRDPIDLFDGAEFQKTGVMVWGRNYASVDRSKLCESLGIEHRPVTEIDDSQFLISRVKHEETLRKALELAQQDTVIEQLWGNFPDTLKYALYCLKREFTGVRSRPRPLVSQQAKGATSIAAMCYFDLEEEQVFQNRRWCRFKLHNSPEIAGSLFEPFARKCLGDLRSRWKVSDALGIKREWVGEWLLDRDTKKGVLHAARRVVLRDGNFVEGLEEFGVEFWSAESSSGELQLMNGKLELLAEITETHEGVMTGKWCRTKRECRLVKVDALSSDESMNRFLELDFNRARFVGADFEQDSITHIFDHSPELSEAVAILYGCCGLAASGRKVLFHTPCYNWLYRIGHPGVSIVHNSFPSFKAISEPAEGPELVVYHADGGVAFRLAREIGIAEEKCKRVMPGTRPEKPSRVDNVPKAKRLDFKDYVLIFPFAEDSGREWPAAHWNRLSFLLRRAGFDVVAVGQQKEQVERFSKELGSAHVFWASGEGAEWMLDVMLLASAVIATDCGHAHLAVAHGIRTICLVSEFPEDCFFPESGWEIVSGDSDCIHCWRKPEKGFAPICNVSCSALSAISPEKVFRQFESKTT